jgi:hypothetical protein
MSVASTEHRETLSPKVEPVPKSDRKRFQEIVEAHRGELLAHCYRFTASLVRTTYLLLFRDASACGQRQMSPADMGTLLHEWLEWHA